MPSSTPASAITLTASSSTQESTTASLLFTIASPDWCLPSRAPRNEPDLAAAAPGSILGAGQFFFGQKVQRRDQHKYEERSVNGDVSERDRTEIKQEGDYILALHPEVVFHHFRIAR